MTNFRGQAGNLSLVIFHWSFVIFKTEARPSPGSVFDFSMIHRTLRFSHGSLENPHSASVPAGTRPSAGAGPVADKGSSDQGLRWNVAPHRQPEALCRLVCDRVIMSPGSLGEQAGKLLRLLGAFVGQQFTDAFPYLRHGFIFTNTI